MSAPFSLLVPISLAAVAIVLGFGLFNMLRGGHANTSQMLMRWRVGLQFMALVVILAAVWWRAG
jgi:hypothetical protein